MAAIWVPGHSVKARERAAAAAVARRGMSRAGGRPALTGGVVGLLAGRVAMARSRGAAPDVADLSVGRVTMACNRGAAPDVADLLAGRVAMACNRGAAPDGAAPATGQAQGPAPLAGEAVVSGTGGVACSDMTVLHTVCCYAIHSNV
jgi:hypothetical protein